jgi:hypothetical protein
MLDSIKETLEALNSFGAWGHLLTFGASVLTTAFFFLRYAANSRAEIRRLRLEIRSQYADQLMRQRLRHYTACYALLSEFAKRSLGFRVAEMRDPGVSRTELEALSDALSDWDSQHSLLMSSDATEKIYQLRVALREMLTALPTVTPDAKLDFDSFRSLLGQIEKVEVALKTDLGIFAVDDFLRLPRPSYYSDSTIVRRHTAHLRSSSFPVRFIRFLFRPVRFILFLLAAGARAGPRWLRRW